MGTESAIQKRIVDWLALVLPQDSIIHHSPNEGIRHVSHKRKLRALGTRWGWPDLEIFVPPKGFLTGEDGYQFAPIFLEVKAKTGRMNENQAEVHRALRTCACHIAIVHSIAEVHGYLSTRIELNIGNGNAMLLQQLDEKIAAA
jgi:hypothetical protein